MAAGRAGAADRAGRGAGQGAADGAVRHRPAHPGLGPLGAEERAGRTGHRARVLRRGGADRRRRPRGQGRRPGQRRGPPGLRALPQLPGRPAAPVHQHQGPGRARPGRVRGVRRTAGRQRVGAQRPGRAGRGGDLRPVRERRAHRAVVPGRRRGRADHRRRSDRDHGRRGGAARGRPARGDHRPVRLPPRAGPAARRDAGAERRRDQHHRGAGEAEHARGLRRRDGDVRQAGRAAGHDREHEPRREDRHARPPVGRDRDRLGHRGAQHADDQGHLRPGDVRDLVLDVGDARTRPGPQPGDHPQVRVRRLRAGLRHRAGGPLRQGDPRLDEGVALDVRRDQGRPARHHRRDPLGGSVQGRAGDHLPAELQRLRCRRQGSPELLCQQLPRPGRPPRGDRCRQERAGRVGLRDGLGPVHLRHPADPQGAGRCPEQLPRHRGHHPLQLLLRRQRRAFRDPAQRRGRGHLRRAQPRQHHRRRSAL